MYDFSNFSFTEGKWLVYYDKRKGHYYSFDMETGVLRNISRDIPGRRMNTAVILYMMQWRRSGWLEKDESSYYMIITILAD